MNKNVMVLNVELNWVRTGNTVDYFGKPVWETELAVYEEARVPELEAVGKVSYDEENKKWYTNVKRSAIKRDGSDNTPVRVVDSAKQPVDTSVIKVSNGTVGNVIVYQASWEFQGKSGVKTILDAIQITKLVEYTGSNKVDFDIVGGGLSAANELTVVEDELDYADIPF